ncbi:23S rRNA (guanosine(2251)-2'-O)-methyltransferase RlmB [Sneathiella limimaris]|uniref:23S rRNA (guanosine(2251)-2'-O)-methyltransferase RlmB n=1 Tax=Sneathiella limimaris TaxID=1964213 RepID=UPI00146F8F17|nr:23S rRNA (guanosine(2251)-2'-O)-methyltransferase RlmB [Sneathiella limimaris]
MSTRKTPKGQKSKFSPGRSKSGKAPRNPEQKTAGHSPKDAWLYGEHAVLAALENPVRKIKRLVITKASLEAFSQKSATLADLNNIEMMQGHEIAELLPENAIHQGIALQASALPQLDIEDIPELLCKHQTQAVAVLDQVTDPHNVGALLRSAAAFDIAALIVPDRHSPPITGVLARSSSGAVETVPLIRVNNLARAMDKLAEYGFWRIGMDGKSDQELDIAIKGTDKIAIVLGSEGKGLRRLTEEKCDLLAKLPISPKIESLNVSNAGAIAFYEIHKSSRKSA